jgi:hypothetical protein
MRKNTFLVMSVVSLVASAGAAVAGPCTGRIEQVSKQLASRDAGSGPTSAGGSQATQGGAVTSTGTIQGQGSATGSSGVTTAPRQVPKAGEAAETEATPAMNAATQGRATSPSDARAQTQGQPTSAQIAQGERASGPDHMRQAMTALDRARAFDREGKEADCMSAVQEADQLSGMR